MVSKVLGFEREIVLGYFYGTSVKCLSLVGAIVLATLIIRMFFQRVTFD